MAFSYQCQSGTTLKEVNDFLIINSVITDSIDTISEENSLVTVSFNSSITLGQFERSVVLLSEFLSIDPAIRAKRLFDRKRKVCEALVYDLVNMATSVTVITNETEVISRLQIMPKIRTVADCLFLGFPLLALKAYKVEIIPISNDLIPSVVRQAGLQKIADICTQFNEDPALIASIVGS